MTMEEIRNRAWDLSTREDNAAVRELVEFVEDLTAKIERDEAVTAPA